MLESLANRIAYLRGLADGMDVNEQTSEGRLLVEMIGILDDMYGEFRELHTRVEETEDYVEALDEDLEDVETFLFDDDEDLYETVGDCSQEAQGKYVTYADMDDDEDAYVYEENEEDHMDTTYEFACPSCQEVIFLHEGMDEEGYNHYVIESPGREADFQAINPT